MARLIGLCLVGCAMCVTPVAAEEDQYDGPTAIKPLAVTPKPQHSAPPNTVCDFEHQCYPEKGGPMVSAPLAPPVVAAKPAAPDPKSPMNPSSRRGATAWVGHCRTTGSRTTSTPCRWPRGAVISGAVGGAGWRELHADAGPPVPQAVPPQMDGRRNIGCGWWPIGSDADRDCAAGGRPF
jgi:hypothetical protein